MYHCFAGPTEPNICILNIALPCQVGVVPVELLKVRLQLQTAVRGQPGYVGPLSLLRRIRRTEGLPGAQPGGHRCCAGLLGHACKSSANFLAPEQQAQQER